MTERMTRRNALTGAAIVGIAVPTLAACGGGGTTFSADSASSTPTSSGTSGPSPKGGGGFTTTEDIPEGSGTIFADQGVVVTQPTAGEFKGFTNICTHMGCPVANVTDTINCICHGSMYSIVDGSVVAGPAPSPLAAVGIKVTGDQIAKT